MRRAPATVFWQGCAFFLIALLGAVGVGELRWPALLWLIVLFIFRRAVWWLYLGLTFLLGLQLEVLNGWVLGSAVGGMAISLIWMEWWEQQRPLWRGLGLWIGGTLFCAAFLMVWQTFSVSALLIQSGVVGVVALWPPRRKEVRVTAPLVTP